MPQRPAPEPAPDSADSQAPEPGSTPDRPTAPLLRAGSASVRGARKAGRATSRAAAYSFRQARRASHAEGAGETGLFRLVELNAVGAAGDAAVAISLAGTLFFQVPSGEARSQVALFLGLTMLPFAIVAPLIGPILDRFSHGRRWAIGATTALRAFLCWVLAGAVHTQSPAMFAAALGCLVSAKAYGVTKAAAVPRLLPPELTLVRANSRISLAGVVGVAVSAPIAILASRIGPEWSLRYAFVIFAFATVLAILLPPAVDDASGELSDALPSGGTWGRRAGLLAVPRAVVTGLRANAGLRLLSGFLTLYLAFLVREVQVPGWSYSSTALLALVIGAAGLGNSLGIGLGNVARGFRPEMAVLVALAVDVIAATLATAFYGVITLTLLGLCAGLAQSFAKLCLDALIQRDVAERRRSRTFARSETLLQLAWVIGGFVGIVLPLIPRLGLGVAATLLALLFAWTIASTRQGAQAATDRTGKARLAGRDDQTGVP